METPVYHFDVKTARKYFVTASKMFSKVSFVIIIDLSATSQLMARCPLSAEYRNDLRDFTAHVPHIRLMFVVSVTY
jgi:hypothetical protein